MNKQLKPRNLLVLELHSPKYSKKIQMSYKKYNRNKSKKECNEYIRGNF